MTEPRRHIEGVHCLDDVLSSFPGGGGGVLPYMGYIGICDPKG